MQLRGRNKVSAQFSMSSMTDIVFLLLIFFMLTSTLVTTSALDIILPQSKAKTVKKQTVAVTINEDLQYYIDERPVSFGELERALMRTMKKGEETVVVLRADKNVPTGKTVEVMDIAYRNKWKMVLATDPKK